MVALQLPALVEGMVIDISEAGFATGLREPIHGVTSLHHAELGLAWLGSMNGWGNRKG